MPVANRQEQKCFFQWEDLRPAGRAEMFFSMGRPEASREIQPCQER
jgi:hypothetical protein